MAQNSSSQNRFWHQDGKRRLAVAVACLFIATPAVGQTADSRAVTVAPAGSMPPGVVIRTEAPAVAVEKPERSALRSSGPEPLSERAAAAATRAQRALASEDGSDFGPEDVKQIELVDNVDASVKSNRNATPAEGARTGTGITMTNRTKTSAVKPMPTCVAGCY